MARAFDSKGGFFHAILKKSYEACFLNVYIDRKAKLGYNLIWKNNG
jgi:hypothetical protein